LEFSRRPRIVWLRLRIVWLRLRIVWIVLVLGKEVYPYFSGGLGRLGWVGWVGGY
jgi:hypothetical protein